jgi:hypothetical protein
MTESEWILFGLMIAFIVIIFSILIYLGFRNYKIPIDQMDFPVKYSNSKSEKVEYKYFPDKRTESKRQSYFINRREQTEVYKQRNFDKAQRELKEAQEHYKLNPHSTEAFKRLEEAEYYERLLEEYQYGR